MPTYKINKAPSQSSLRAAALGEKLLSMGLGALINNSEADANLQREKDLYTFKQQNAPLDEKSTSEAYMARIEKLQSDLDKQEAKGLENLDAKQIQAVEKGKKEIEILRKAAMNRAVKEVEEKQKSQLDIEAKKASIEESKARTNAFNRTAPTKENNETRKLDQADLRILLTEAAQVQSRIDSYEKNFLDAPEDLKVYAQELRAQILEAKKKQKLVPATAPTTPTEAPKKGSTVKDKSTEELLNLLQ